MALGLVYLLYDLPIIGEHIGLAGKPTGLHFTGSSFHVDMRIDIYEATG